MNTLSKGVLVALGLVTLASCGGGDVASGGAGGTGISQGPITGFGSVYVNGVKIEDTPTTRIEIEDNATGTSRANLKVGMVVKVEWEKDASGKLTAKNIIYGDDVQGPAGVVSVDGLTGDATFTVLGQTVMTHAASTVFDGVADAAALAAMPVTTIVEVSGLRDGAGVIHATRIEVKTGETELELKGIASVASVGGLFTLGSGTAAVVVNYSGTPAVAVGACVEVKSVTGISGGQLMASEVQLDDDCTAGGGEGYELELKGFPSAITATTFVVNGQSVNYSGATFPPGTSAVNLGSSVVIEVEGSLVNGVLIAKKISFEIEGANEAKGTVNGPVAADGTFSITLSEAEPALPLVPTSFTVDNLTVYEDKTGAANFGRASIASGQFLKVYYRVDGAGIKIATRIKRES